MNRFLLSTCLAAVALSGCGKPSSQRFQTSAPFAVPVSPRPSAIPSLSLPALSSEQLFLDTSLVELGLAERPVPVLAGGETEDVSVGAPYVPGLEKLSQVFEFTDVALSDALRAVVVDFAGLPLVMSGDALTKTVSFSGGPFTTAQALDALDVALAAEGLTLRRLGPVVSVVQDAGGVVSGGSSDSSESSGAFEAVGFTPVYQSSPVLLRDSLAEVFPDVNLAVFKNTLQVSGRTNEVNRVLAFARDLDAQDERSLPWRVVSVSPAVAEKAPELLAFLVSEEDPLAFTVVPGADGLVLLTAQTNAKLNEAVDVLTALEQGRPGRFVRVVSVASPEPLLEALNTSFTADVEAGLLSFAALPGQLVLRGELRPLSEARAFLRALSPDPSFVQVRAVVAETLRGSEVDRSFTLGVDPAASGVSGALSSSGLSLGVDSFNASLRFLDADTNTRLLATPRLSVASGASADLTVGAQVPYLAASESEESAARVAYRDTGVKLSVSPVVLADGSVRLDVSQELSNASSNAFSNIDSPSFSTRSMTTQVVVAPGETVAVAGLDYDSASTSSSSLSGAGSSENRKLLVLLTATPSDPAVRYAAVRAQLDALNLAVLEARNGN